MIELGNHLLDFGDWVNFQHRLQYFLALTQILNRGELNLVSLSLQDKDNIDKKTFEKKIEVAVIYQQFIFKVLEKCIKSLNMKGVEAYKR